MLQRAHAKRANPHWIIFVVCCGAIMNHVCIFHWIIHDPHVAFLPKLQSLSQNIYTSALIGVGVATMREKLLPGVP